ncbi:SMI1/KNR4 family protein [Psychrobacillus sp. NPDC058041]|uniref:SMI1/KNR4 family protein n=1 Tax=Psychrobacillus sp. NPDC058041 TaxID=3346310 RepID=UPI0036D8633C
MNINDFIEQFNEKYPDVDRFEGATDEMVEAHEKMLGYHLPISFIEFLKRFSNGILLLDSEPIGGVSKDSPCSNVSKVSRIIPDIPNEVLIVETNEMIESTRLVSFTMFDGGDSSNNHWVFLCEDGITNNDYRVGFISQISNKVVKVLSNFEEWLTIFWSNNDDEEPGIPVFHAIYPDYDERGVILDS